MQDTGLDNGLPLAVKFGDQLMQDGFTAVPNSVLEHYAELGITNNEMMFTIQVWNFWWRLRDPYPSLATIAERMGLQRRQTQQYVESLRNKGFLKTEQRYSESGSKLTNEYDFSPMLKAIREHIASNHGR